MGESGRKNVFQPARAAVELTYHKLPHFLTDAPWSSDKINQRRWEVMNQCRQTKISRVFSLIVDDSGHRKSGCLLRPIRARKPRARAVRNFTAGVGRQYIGEIERTSDKSP